MRQNVLKQTVPRSRRGLFRFALRTIKGATDTAIRGTATTCCRTESRGPIRPKFRFHAPPRPEHEPAAILESATRCLTLSPAAPPRSYRHKAALSPTLANELLGILHPYRIFVLLYGGVQDLRMPKPTSAKASHPSSISAGTCCVATKHRIASRFPTAATPPSRPFVPSPLHRFAASPVSTATLYNMTAPIGRHPRIKIPRDNRHRSGASAPSCVEKNARDATRVAPPRDTSIRKARPRSGPRESATSWPSSHPGSDRSMPSRGTEYG